MIRGQFVESKFKGPGEKMRIYIIHIELKVRKKKICMLFLINRESNGEKGKDILTSKGRGLI